MTADVRYRLVFVYPQPGPAARMEQSVPPSAYCAALRSVHCGTHLVDAEGPLYYVDSVVGPSVNQARLP